MPLLSKQKKRELFEVDAKWHIKIIFRMVMNVFCMASIMCAVLTLVKSNSKFAPKSFQQPKAVLAYIPCDAITIVWNMINIVFFCSRRKAFSNIVNTAVHFFLGVGFAIVGIYVTVVCWNGYKGLHDDLYDIKALGEHEITGIRGQKVLVSADNISKCPAFPNCGVQNMWLAGAEKRSMVALIGSFLFDGIFTLHVVFFLWCISDAVFGLRGRSQRLEDKETKERRLREESENTIPLSASSDRSFEYKQSKPAITVQDTTRSGRPEMTRHKAGALDMGRRSTSAPARHSLISSSLSYEPSLSHTMVSSHPRHSTHSKANSRDSITLNPDGRSRRSTLISSQAPSQSGASNTSPPTSPGHTKHQYQPSRPSSLRPWKSLSESQSSLLLAGPGVPRTTTTTTTTTTAISASSNPATHPPGCSCAHHGQGISASSLATLRTVQARLHQGRRGTRSGASSASSVRSIDSARSSVRNFSAPPPRRDVSPSASKATSQAGPSKQSVPPRSVDKTSDRLSVASAEREITPVPRAEQSSNGLLQVTGPKPQRKSGLRNEFVD